MSAPIRPAFFTTRTAWLAAAAVWAVSAAVTWSFRDVLRASPAGEVAMLIVALPPAIALYLLAVAVSEGGAMLLLWLPFKVVTLFRVPTAISEPGLKFVWGFARNAQGRLVASEDAMSLISLGLYGLAGAVWYLVG